jgi:hypothetical protein
MFSKTKILGVRNMKVARIMVILSLFIVLSLNTNGQAPVSPNQIMQVLPDQIKEKNQSNLLHSVTPTSTNLAISKSKLLLRPVVYHSYESLNWLGKFIRHANGLGELSDFTGEITNLDVDDSTFALVPGLADSSYVSFKSKNYPTSYLRHQDGRIKLTDSNTENSQLFKEDATFKRIPGLAGVADSSAVSFESYNYPGHYLRHRGDYTLWVEQDDGTPTFKGDATFIEEDPRVAVEARPERHVTEKPSSNVVMVWNLMSDCCPEHPDCIIDEFIGSYMAFMDDGTWGSVPAGNYQEKPAKIAGNWKHEGNQFWWHDDRNGKDHYLNWAEEKMEGQEGSYCFSMTRVL